MQDLILGLDDKTKNKLRKIKELPLTIKAIAYGGNKGGPAMAVQFNRDIKVYNLYEALLYLEQYEDQTYYVVGTTKKIVDAIPDLLNNPDNE